MHANITFLLYIIRTKDRRDKSDSERGGGKEILTKEESKVCYWLLLKIN